jgi:acetyltransferase-like isoleucine patch superfamily enzyme
MAQETRHKIEDKDLIRHKLFHDQKSSFRKYADLVIGDRPLFRLVQYELLTTFLGPIPGALGLFLRRLFYPCLFKHIGKSVVFGRSIVVRYPDKIRLGNRVVIDDYCLIDARGAGEDGIIIDDDTIINRSVTIQSKVGPIHIGKSTNVGAGSVIVSMGGVYIGEMVAIGGGCYISGGGFTVSRNQDSDREQEKYTKGPVLLDKKSRFGMGVIVLDGVHVAEGCIVGAGSVVTDDLPEYSVAAGAPAKVTRPRGENRDKT